MKNRKKSNIQKIRKGSFEYGTIEDNIRFYNNNVSSSDIVHAAKMACIHEEIIKFPMGYNTVLGDYGATISGGQRQRLSIARTLAANPEMLLIDEGTSNLDIDTEEAVIKNLFATNKTILFISHRHKNIDDVNHINLIMDCCKKKKN